MSGPHFVAMSLVLLVFAGCNHTQMQEGRCGGRPRPAGFGLTEPGVVLVHRIEMSNLYQLQSLRYLLDDRQVFFGEAAGGLRTDCREIEIHAAPIASANHALRVEIVYTGNASAFPDLEGYVFKLKSSYTFFAAPLSVTEVRVVAFERGGPGTEVEDRPYIRYEVNQIHDGLVAPASELPGMATKTSR